MNRAQQLAAWIAEPPPIPDEAIRLAKLALVDLVGVTVAGAEEPVSRIVARQVARAICPDGATVFGAAARANAPEAALANATMGHALDFDDSSLVLGGHPTVTMLPALLALAEQERLPCRAVLEAYVVGFEATTRLARAVNFEHYEKGWHPTATLGTVGTAAAAARLLRLPAEEVMNALGLAASSASGVKANFGTMAKPFQVGQASQKGLLCALLAADGMTASAEAFEGRQGFFNVYNGPGNHRPEALAAAGERLEIFAAGLAFKKYACCGSTHAPIDAALELARTVPAEAIERVGVAINRRRLPHVDRPGAATPLAAKFSLQYTVAAALCDGALGLRHFTEAAVARPDIQALAARVVPEGLDGGDALAQGCVLTVGLRDGGTRVVRRADAEGRGAEAYPDYMAAKFVDCVEARLDRPAAEALLERLLGFERCEDVRAVLGRLGKQDA